MHKWFFPANPSWAIIWGTGDINPKRKTEEMNGQQCGRTMQHKGDHQKKIYVSDISKMGEQGIQVFIPFPDSYWWTKITTRGVRVQWRKTAIEKSKKGRTAKKGCLGRVWHQTYFEDSSGQKQRSQSPLIHCAGSNFDPCGLFYNKHWKFLFLETTEAPATSTNIPQLTHQMTL